MSVDGPSRVNRSGQVPQLQPDELKPKPEDVPQPPGPAPAWPATGAQRAARPEQIGGVGAAQAPARVAPTDSFSKTALSVQQLRQVMPTLSDAKASAMLPHLNRAMQEFGINTPRRAAAFLAQVAHESGEFKFMEELASGRAYEGRRDLGNTQPGDGVRFKGRGPIQLTGRANYADASRALGIDLVNNPELASRPDIGFKLAGWFWQKKDLNRLADQGNFNEITRRVNGGFNGKASRDSYLAKASNALGAGLQGGPLSTGDTPIPPNERGPRTYGMTPGSKYATSSAESQRMVHNYALNGKVDENLLFLMVLRAMQRVNDSHLKHDPGFAAFAAAAGWNPGMPIPEDLKAEYLTQLLTESARQSNAPHRLEDAYKVLERRFPPPAEVPQTP